MWKQFIKHTWLLGTNLILFIMGMLIFMRHGNLEMGESYTGCFSAIICMAVLLILSISCVGEKAQEVSGWFRILVFIDMIFCMTTILSNSFDEYTHLRELIYGTETVLFACITLLSYFYWYYIRTDIGAEKGRDRPQLYIENIFMNTMGFISLLMLILNRKFEFLFWLDDACNYHRGEYFKVSWICPILMMASCGLLIILQKIRITWKLVHLSYLILPACIYPFQILHEKMMPLNIAITLALLLMYCVNYMNRRKVLLEQKELLAIQQREMLEMEVQLMISQIQPHFLYNTIAMIRGLCREDAAAAADSLGYFSAFLRGSLHMMQRKDCVSIEEELKLVESYMFLEQKRFGERLEYIEDIEDVSFDIPALTIEPILENAVHHGIEEKEEGGMVLLEVTEDEDDYIVRITDDGAGFDTNAQVDTKKHIGMTNVKERLWKMCGGTLEFESTIGEGTTATIRIPKKK